MFWFKQNWRVFNITNTNWSQSEEDWERMVSYLNATCFTQCWLLNTQSRSLKLSLSCFQFSPPYLLYFSVCKKCICTLLQLWRVNCWNFKVRSCSISFLHWNTGIQEVLSTESYKFYSTTCLKDLQGTSTATWSLWIRQKQRQMKKRVFKVIY